MFKYYIICKQDIEAKLTMLADLCGVIYYSDSANISTMELDDLLPYLTQKYHGWLLEQRSLHLRSARQLSREEQSSLHEYFDDKIIDSARIAVVEHISNPAFYSELTELGISNPLDFTQSAGITLINCILICKYYESSPLTWLSILFHELVHVVQYDILGSKKLVELYVAGWAQNGYQYHDIPFERQAYELEGRFNRGGSPFSVRQFVKQELEREANG